ncbi:hypothetical protein PybrP1_004697 [[Pythium] brassicae (nom. inval.)]|nr:hypothetical protein PybrP1_004697 [[Pythium] brassicae (nom. inval.)]
MTTTGRRSSPPALTQFLAQFADAVFAQWRQASEKERFWLDAAFLRSLLEDAAAKLPRSAALKAQLQRELAAAATELRSLLDARYVALQSTQQQQTTTDVEDEKQAPLFSEEDVERALATVDDAARRELSARLALDDFDRESDRTEEPAGVACVEALVAQLQLVCARAYESDDERQRKQALILQRVVHSAEPLVSKWARGNWDCSSEGSSSEELQRLRVALQRLVVLDAVATVASDDSRSNRTLLAAPWSAFYRPPASAQLLKADYDAEAAKLYGLLLALAIYFPIVLADDSDDDEATSDEAPSDSDSSDDSELSRGVARPAAAEKRLDAVEQAKRTVGHVAFAARKRTDPSWLVAVLTFLHELPKPTSYTDAVNGDAEPALTPAEQRALHSCLSDVYTRAFSHPELLANYSAAHESKRSDWALFTIVVCVRRAAHFMRAERRQSVPAVTTAMSALAGIALPASFWDWAAHVKKLFVQQSEAAREAAQKLSKAKASKTASALLSAAEVTDAELDAVAENYGAFLQRATEDSFVAVVRDDAGFKPAEIAAAITESDALFFTDSVGGAKEAGGGGSSSKKKNKRTKKKAAKQQQNQPVVATAVKGDGGKRKQQAAASAAPSKRAKQPRSA